MLMASVSFVKLKIKQTTFSDFVLSILSVKKCQPKMLLTSFVS